MVQDDALVELFFNRSEAAIRELDTKYGKACVNTILCRNNLSRDGSHIYLESGDYIICYSFTQRDIAQIEGFWDMVNSAERISEINGE